MNFRFVMVLFVVMLISFLHPAVSEDLDGAEIMKRLNEMHRLNAEKEILELELINKNGKSKLRKLERYSLRREPGVDSLLAVMVEPENVKGTGVLLVEGADGDDQQWLYMPALGGVKRVDAKDRKGKFFGTDFCYGDFRSDDTALYRYTMLGNEEIDGRICYVVEAVPLTDFEMKSTGYSKRVFWISADIFFAMKVEFFDTRGKLKKVMVNRDLVEVSGTAWRADHMEITSVKTGHRSVMKVLSRDIGGTIDPQIFTVDSLKAFAKSQ